ncbi:DUF2867 domain-containing protein [Seonamhaeicola sp. ML3]|uniref:DUF2867 domain-containing protein n=1 Tax=Seonamhaeicola sp. ML3 TaxID=2937786 RepID=UPI00200D7437|nr:DUF2867 domain-containing protein [Seonamhaeicola sp. ML3]
MKIREETIPNTNAIKSALSKIDFKDTFATTNKTDDLKTISNLIFGTFPGWIGFLMKLRNTLVKPFGLKVDMPEDYNIDFKVGGYSGFFKIYNILDNELILGADDKHLNFRVSILDSSEPSFNIKVTTLVEYNNFFGKTYMVIVAPFHRIVVKSMVKRAYNVDSH